MGKIYVGVDVGKEVHWACCLDSAGEILLSRRVFNDEADLRTLIAETEALGASEIAWTVDLIAVEASLLLAVLHGADHKVRYLPGMGPRLGAEFLAAIGNIDSFASANHLASYAGLAPVSHDSGKTVGRHRRPHRYNRQLRRVMYLSALNSIRYCPESKTYFEKKKSEGKRGTTAVMALARRRTNVLWALVRDNRTWTPSAQLHSHRTSTAA